LVTLVTYVVEEAYKQEVGDFSGLQKPVHLGFGGIHDRHPPAVRQHGEGAGAEPRLSQNGPPLKLQPIRASVDEINFNTEGGQPNFVPCPSGSFARGLTRINTFSTPSGHTLVSCSSTGHFVPHDLMIKFVLAESNRAYRARKPTKSAGKGMQKKAGGI
jgi:hypothetical protein